MTIMIIDDVSIMRMILRDILVRYCKYNKTDIIEATGWHDALQKYRQKQPNLVLCDIAMPDMNGVEVVREILKINENAKIIMCTASSDREDVRECIRAGAKDYIVKPPKPERVVKAVDRFRDGNDAEEGKHAKSDAGDTQEGRLSADSFITPPPLGTPVENKKITQMQSEISGLKNEVTELKDEISHLKKSLEKAQEKNG